MKNPEMKFDVTDANGNVLTLYVDEEALFIGAEAGQMKSWVGSAFRTATGQVVKWHKKGEYEIVETGLRLFSDSPDAP